MKRRDRYNFSPLRGLFVGALVTAAMACTSQAANVVFDVSTGDWNVGTNWSTDALPGSADTAFIRGGRTVNVTSTVPTVQVINMVNQAGTGTLNVEAGALLTANNGPSGNALLVGNVASGTATVNVNGGQFDVIGASVIGNPAGSMGRLNVTNGLFNANGNLRVAINATSVGAISVSGGRMSVQSNLTVGEAGSGSLTITGGTVSTTALSAGSAAGGAGTINVSSGRLEVTNGLDSYLGERVTGTTAATFTQSGGVVQMGASGEGRMIIGTTNASGQTINSSFTISGGTYNGRFLVGSATGLGDGSAVLTIAGNNAVIGSASASGNGFELRSTGKIVFQLDAAGISMLNYANSDVVLGAGADFWIDGSAYTGGENVFTLIDGASVLGFDGLETSIFGFADGYTTNLVLNGSDIQLQITGIPEPSTWALLGLGLGIFVWRARARRVAKIS